MLRRRVNGYDTAHIEVGQGETLVCVHGSLCDFRVWSAVPGPLSRRHRVVALSLRRSFPEQWDGVSAAGLSALSANTDGVMVRLPRSLVDQRVLQNREVVPIKSLYSLWEFPGTAFTNLPTNQTPPPHFMDADPHI